MIYGSGIYTAGIVITVNYIDLVACVAIYRLLLYLHAINNRSYTIYYTQSVLSLLTESATPTD